MSVLESVIGLLAPPVCLGCGTESQALCEACVASEIMPYGERCWRCGALSPLSRTCSGCRWFGGPRRVFVTTDYAGLAAKLVQAYKFAQQRPVAVALAELMATTFRTFNSDQQMTKAGYLVVPVPTASQRQRRRGFDHSAGLAKIVASQLTMEYGPALGRLGQAAQVGQRRDQRLKLSETDYFIRSGNLVRGRNILLIDDVLTTGATLRAATKALRLAGAKRIDGLVFAKRL